MSQLRGIDEFDQSKFTWSIVLASNEFIVAIYTSVTGKMMSIHFGIRNNTRPHIDHYP